jgi:hypothetical protein
MAQKAIWHSVNKVLMAHNGYGRGEGDCKILVFYRKQLEGISRMFEEFSWP